MTQPLERRLAAIVMADVAGYAGFLQRDEVGTRALFNKLGRNFFEPLCRIHGGRIIKTMGDAFLMEFSSVLNAVTCAVELQKQMNLHIQAEESLDLRSLQFRIAVNLGDIIVEGDDIHGDGVNVVARLQSHADPGGVCLSDTVYAQIRGKTDTPFEDGGTVALKNIDGDRQIYLWSAQRSGARSTALVPHAELRATAEIRQATIDVLPFENRSGDPEQEFFSDGITEDIITELSRFRELRVKARNSAFAFKGQAQDVRDIGTALDVDYVVDGSVRKAGDRVRITVQLIEVETGSHVWAEKYDRAVRDIFELQDAVTKAIAAVLPNRLRDTLTERVRRNPTESYSAYTHFLQGRWLFLASAGNDPQAVLSLQKALEIDPHYAQAHALLGNLYAYSLFSLGIWYGDPETRARDHIDLALRYGRNDPGIHAKVGKAFYWLGESDKALRHIETALRLNPNDVEARIVHGSVLNGAGRSEEGLAVMQEALALDPQMTDFAEEPKAECLYMLGRYRDSLDILEAWQDPPPHTHAQIAACYAHLGDMEKSAEAARTFRKVCSESSDFARYAKNHARICQLQKDKDNWLTGYRKAGLLD
jgi:TolB-like protein